MKNKWPNFDAWKDLFTWDKKDNWWAGSLAVGILVGLVAIWLLPTP